MPFNFLKKSRHYNVTSKRLFVISIHHLLDTSTTVDCTLSSESTGQECLENVCQRLTINQPEFFGLRYIVKGTKGETRWIDLERPLHRQLEKHAVGTKLHLRVMYYVTSGVTLLDDEVSRYYYYLQLKSDVEEGKISCDIKQAIILALYCRQAEYDGYQKDKNTIEYLKTLLPFPKRMIDEGVIHDRLIEEVIQQNPGLQNLTQSAAEELYIAACQQLDGYGKEKFLVRDSDSYQVQLGIAISGIAVSYPDRTRFYSWHEINNVVNLKRTFNIECNNNTVSFTFPDAESGRYFWKLCVLQHTFYMKFEKNQTDVCEPNLFQNVPEEVNDSREDLIDERNVYCPETPVSGMQSAAASNMSLATQQLIRTSGQSWTTVPQEYGSQNCNHPYLLDQADGSRLQSLSCLDLSNNNNYSQERERLKALLPQYRPAPDYETAIQQKYLSNSTDIHLNSSQLPRRAPSTGILNDRPIFSGSQPDVNHLNNGGIDALRNQILQHKYPDVTQTANTSLLGQLNINMYTNLDLAQRLQMMKIKPPPPYPANRLSSTSTPDLAVASHRTLLGYRGAYVSGSSPDLVSTRQFLNTQYGHYPYQIGQSQPYLPHGTFENLNMIEEQPSIVLPLRQPMKNHQPYRQQHHLQDSNGVLQRSTKNGSIEPIYENVPLPWQPEPSNEMRNRTSSIQSAPGGMRHENILHTTGHVDEQQHNPRIEISTPDTHQISAPPREMRHSTVPPTLTQNLSSSSYLTRDQMEPPDRAVSTPSSSSLHQQQQTHTQPQHQHHQPPIRLQSEPIHHNSSHISSTSFFNSSSTPMSHNSTTTTTFSINDSNVSAATKEKRKNRWGILGRKKNTDKQKSATLGREKSKNKEKVELTKQDVNLRHRWSTGVSRLQPLSATFSKDKLCQILDSKLNDSQLFMEFERIPKRRQSARYDCALLEENKTKNSDPNFLPYDDNRVRLTPTMDNRMGYVNASHITATVGTTQRFYIIAQSPHDSLTTNIFWQCVWEADVYLIVQLSEELTYIPPTTNRCLEFGQFQVYQEFSQTTDRCVTSKLRLYHVQSRRYRSVWHLSYSEWKEQNCPRDVGHFLDFLEELSSVRLASINEVPPGHNTNPPVLVHCSEGGGRSGVTLLADLLLYTLDHNEDLDIPRVTGQLRHQRDNIIPSLAQYKFIYALLITYLKRTRLI